MCRVVLKLMHALVIPSFSGRWSYNTIVDTILTMFDALVSLKSFPVGNVTSPLQTTNGGAISTKPKEFLWTKRRRAHQSCPLHQGRVQIVQGLLFFLDFFFNKCPRLDSRFLSNTEVKFLHHQDPQKGVSAHLAVIFTSCVFFSAGLIYDQFGWSVVSCCGQFLSLLACVYLV